MRRDLLKWLICPECQGDIVLREEVVLDENIQEGKIKCISCNITFPIINSIPRFVSLNNYTDNFGFQWNLFKKTQLDSCLKATISKDRFFLHSGWRKDDMRDAVVLDAGCGAGRFAEIALSIGAHVIAIDYSNAVDACWENLKQFPNLHVVQADIYKLPFRKRFFDYVYCFGVLQHTPDVKGAFFSLVEKVKKEGKISVDFYKKDWRCIFWTKYWLRPFTRNLSSVFLFKIVKSVVPVLFPMSCFLAGIPFIGRYLKYIIPIANHYGVLSLSKEQLLEMSILDTFDMYSPKYDSPQSEKTVNKWFHEAQLVDIRIFTPGFIVGQGKVR